MNRSLNFTGRKKIECDRVAIRLVGDSALEATVKLGDSGLPLDGRIALEAYSSTAHRRFELGTVGVPSALGACSLEGLEGEALSFRVKVVDANGMLLAELDHVHPRDEGGSRIALLPVEWRALEDEVWVLEMPTGARPKLVVDREARKTNIVGSPVFQALVLPAVVRQVLTRLFIEEDWEPSDDEEDWRDHWLRFARSAGGMEPPPVEDESGRRDFVETCVRGFARSKELKSRWLMSLEEAS